MNMKGILPLSLEKHETFYFRFRVKKVAIEGEG